MVNDLTISLVVKNQMLMLDVTDATALDITLPPVQTGGKIITKIFFLQRDGAERKQH